jgi:SRSO17 transposase
VGTAKCGRSLSDVWQKKNERPLGDSVAIDDIGLEAVFAEVSAAMGAVFAQARTTECARDYVRSLVSAPDAGSTWALAEAAGHASPGRFQALLREAVWDPADLIGRINRLVARDLAVGEEGVFIVDETAMLKHGRPRSGSRPNTLG